ncbi:MAG TPA: hypothetical protein VI913_03815 [Candidatus Peribacteraceae bacterium]|nr:hypothetical protein [Candidatus Peribacteraceae bacterium]
MNFVSSPPDGVPHQTSKWESNIMTRLHYHIPAEATAGTRTPDAALSEGNSGFPTFAFNKKWYALGKRPFHPIIHRVLDRFAKLPKGSWIIEPGNGDHRLGRLQIQRDFCIAGFDISSSAVARANSAITDLGLGDTAVLADFPTVPLDQLRQLKPRGAFSWRVLHTMAPDVRQCTCGRLSEVLPAGASLFVALLSDQSWERQVLGDKYVADTPNDLKDVMEFDRLRGLIPAEEQHLLPDHWRFTFFNEQSAKKLAEEVGFEASGFEIFHEANAWPHLSTAHPVQTWLFVEFRKPGGRNGYDAFKPVTV